MKTDKEDINHFFHNVGKCPNIFNQAALTLQNFEIVFEHFSTFRRKELNYSFQEYFIRITSIILCEILTLRNTEALQ